MDDNKDDIDALSGILRRTPADQQARQRLELEPDHPWTLSLRADVHRLLEHFDEAVADCNRALELEPNEAWTLARRQLSRPWSL